MSGIKKMRAAVLLLGCLLLTGMFAGVREERRDACQYGQRLLYQ